MAVAVLAPLFAAGGIAIASIPGRGGMISACYQNNGGGLRVIDTARHGNAGKCAKSEKRLAWNQQGVQGVKGDPGTLGVKGDPGTLGVKGDPGIQGIKGDPGPVTGVLPSGVSEKGAFVARSVHAGTGDPVETVISFPLSLTAGLPAFYVTSGGAAVPQCTGSAANPTAAPGSLCVYESIQKNTFNTRFRDPATTLDATTTRPFGVILSTSAFSGDAYIYGTWAVTAP
jgi:hypothetical protein